jgi:hypothetical protein
VLLQVSLLVSLAVHIKEAVLLWFQVAVMLLSKMLLLAITMVMVERLNRPRISTLKGQHHLVLFKLEINPLILLDALRVEIHRNSRF